MELDKFEKLLDKELSWRKKEISDLYLCINDNNLQAKDVLNKSLILLIYAHWEGFIKRSSKYYLDFISNKKICHKDLYSNFITITLKGSLKQCLINPSSLSLTNELKFIKKYDKLITANFKHQIKPQDDQDNSIVNTNSNLNTDVFKKIVDIIGIKVSNTFDNNDYIDRFLLNRRNCIGHGSQLSDIPGDEDFELEDEFVAKLKEIMILYLEYFKETLQEYVNKEFYLIKNVDKKDIYDQSSNESLENKLEKIENPGKYRPMS